MTMADFPEHSLYASGRLRLLLVLNLSRFVAPEATTGRPSTKEPPRALFNHLRGSANFLAALRSWEPQPPFERASDQDRIEEEGYRLRIFRTRLRQSQFL